MEFLLQIYSWVTSHLEQILQIVGAFAVIATMTPNSADDKIVKAILDGINFLGANTGKAKNVPTDK